MSAIVPLKATFAKYNPSLRFLIPNAIVNGLNIEAGDSIQVQIKGIFKEKDQTTPTTTDIPMPGKAIMSGASSLAITVKRNIVERYKLKAGYELVINIEMIRS